MYAFSWRQTLTYDIFVAPPPHLPRKKKKACASDAGVVFRYSNGRSDNGMRHEARAAVAIKTTTPPTLGARRCASLITGLALTRCLRTLLPVPTSAVRYTVLHAIVCVRLLAIDSGTIPGGAIFRKTVFSVTLMPAIFSRVSSSN